MNNFVTVEEFADSIKKYCVYDIFLTIYWNRYAKYRKFDASMNELHENEEITMDQWDEKIIDFLKSKTGKFVPVKRDEMLKILDAIEDFFSEADNPQSLIRFPSNDYEREIWNMRHDNIVLHPLLNLVNKIISKSKRKKF